MNISSVSYSIITETKIFFKIAYFDVSTLTFFHFDDVCFSHLMTSALTSANTNGRSYCILPSSPRFIATTGAGPHLYTPKTIIEIETIY